MQRTVRSHLFIRRLTSRVESFSCEMVLAKLVFVVLGVFGTVFVMGESEKLKVSVYYETYCPCSIGFFVKQFYPAYKMLSEYLQVDLIPAGHTMHYSYNGTSVFNCKHGQQECYGNKIHGCVLVHGTNQDQTMEFISCIIDGRYTNAELEYCVNATRIEWTPIKECVTGPLGNDILAGYASGVPSVGLNHVPAVVFNGNYDKLLDERARRGFLPTVCSLLKEKAPEICAAVTMFSIV